MIISDHIARMIDELIEESGGIIELKRNIMAEQLGCAPSQINYVITSRFTPQRGYLIESRRGGGGYIRIVRKSLNKNEFLAHILNNLGDSLDEGQVTSLLQDLVAHQAISNQSVALIATALSSASLSPIHSKEEQNAVRASMLRQLLPALMQ